MCFCRVDQMGSVDSQFAKCHVAEVNQYEIGLRHNDAVNLIAQPSFIDVFQPGGVRNISEYRLHQGAIHGRAAIEHRNDMSSDVTDRTEPSIALGTWVELGLSIGRGMDPMNQLSLLPDRFRCFQSIVTTWSDRFFVGDR